MAQLKISASPLSIDRVVSVLLFFISAVITLLFLWIVGDLCWRGWSSLSWSFLWDAPNDAGRGGGIFPIIMSSTLILTVCLFIITPLGLGSAVFLSNAGQRYPRFSNLIRMVLDLLAGMPSIVFGLFGMVFFGKICGLESSIINGGLTLACMVLPLFVRLSESALSAVPQELRIGAAALGLSQWSRLWKVQLPVAMPGIVNAAVLAIARALAETAALLFTSGYVMRAPESLMDSGRALSVHIYDLSMNVPGGNANAAATALVLILILFVMNTAVMTLLRRRDRT